MDLTTLIDLDKQLLLTLNGVEDKIPVSRRRVSTLKKALGL